MEYGIKKYKSSVDRDVYPGSEFFSIPDTGSEFFQPRSASKDLSKLTQKMVSKLSEI